MADPTDPTRHDASADPLAEAFRAEASEVPAVPGRKLVAAAATARAAQRHRRVVVRRSILGAAAALLLVALVDTGAARSARRLVAGGGSGSGAGNASVVGPGVMVDPSSGLVDGQTLTATALGFDAGTEVTFHECLDLGPPPTLPGDNPAAAGTSTKPSTTAPRSTGGPFPDAVWWCDPSRVLGRARSERPKIPAGVGGPNGESGTRGTPRSEHVGRCPSDDAPRSGAARRRHARAAGFGGLVELQRRQRSRCVDHVAQHGRVAVSQAGQRPLCDRRNGDIRRTTDLLRRLSPAVLRPDQPVGNLDDPTDDEPRARHIDNPAVDDHRSADHAPQHHPDARLPERAAPTVPSTGRAPDLTSPLVDFTPTTRDRLLLPGRADPAAPGDDLGPRPTCEAHRGPEGPASRLRRHHLHPESGEHGRGPAHRGTHDATVVVQYSGCGTVANTTDGRLRLGASTLQWVAALSGFSGGGFSGSGG